MTETLSSKGFRPDILVANSHDPKSMDELARQARVSSRQSDLMRVMAANSLLHVSPTARIIAIFVARPSGSAR